MFNDVSHSPNNDSEENPSAFLLTLSIDPANNYPHLPPSKKAKLAVLRSVLGPIPAWIEAFYIDGMAGNLPRPYSFEDFLDRPSVYAHGGGRHARLSDTSRFSFNPNDCSLSYPGDDPMYALISLNTSPFGETWYGFPHAWWLRTIPHPRPLEIYRID